MKRLIKQSDNNPNSRPFIIPTTPLYNPLGKGEDNSEFKSTDDKSYERMFNKHTMDLIDKRERDKK